MPPLYPTRSTAFTNVSYTPYASGMPTTSHASDEQR